MLAWQATPPLQPNSFLFDPMTLSNPSTAHNILSTNVNAHPAVVTVGKDRRQRQLKTRWVGVDDLIGMQNQWDQLAQESIWVTHTFESNFLIPALQHLASDNVGVLIVEDVAETTTGRLVGLVPVESKPVYRLPFKAAEAWKHDQCFDATPMLHQSCPTEVWQAICQQLHSDGYKLFSLDTVSAEARVNRVFEQVEQDINLIRFQRDRFERAALIPSQSAEQYTKDFVSKSLGKKFRSTMKKLEKLGTIEFELASAESDFKQLAEEFLRIESSGWKGAEGTALASNPDTAAFYRAMIERSAAAGKARIVSLKLDGKAIAMLSDLQSRNVMCSYKTGYDDAFGKFSPGRQIEMKNIEFLHQEGIELSDSCTSPDNDMMNRIWGQKLSFQSLILSLCPGAARTAVRALPLVQSAVHKIRRRGSQ